MQVLCSFVGFISCLSQRLCLLDHIGIIYGGDMFDHFNCLINIYEVNLMSQAACPHPLPLSDDP